MIICVCNNISEDDIDRDQELVDICGNQCGSCLTCPELIDIKIKEKDEDE